MSAAAEAGGLLMLTDVHPALDYLPGGQIELHVAPPPRWPIQHRNVRALHGMLTALLGEPHKPMRPIFALEPWPDGIGWRVYVPDVVGGLRIAGKVHQAELYGRPVMVRCSGLRRVRAPTVSPWNETIVAIDTVTPVCVRAGGDHRKFVHGKPSSSNLLSTLGTWAPSRIGYGVADGLLSLQLLAAETRVERIPIGGRIGVVPAFGGRMVAKVNAPTLWLLRCCETIGLGGRVAYGFGRIRVTLC